MITKTIYTPPKDKIVGKKHKTPLLTVLILTGEMFVMAVDKNGDPLAIIAGGVSYSGAKNALEDQGYNTNWAKWDDNGAFVRMKE